MIAETVVCTKGNLSKIIKWSSSRYNELSKREVINEIAELFKHRKDIKNAERLFYSAPLSGKEHLGGLGYKLAIKNGSATLEDVNSGITYFLRERR